MDQKVVNELERRCHLLIENSKPNDISTGMSGSFWIFRRTLAPIGYPYKAEHWMDEEYLKPIMTDEIFQSDLYDELFEKLYENAYTKVNGEL